MGLLELPPLPELVLEIIKAFLTKRDREFEDFLLSEKEVHQFLLEVANTPPFKRGEAPITNLRTALIVLGDTTTKILVLGLISQKLMRTSFTEFSFHKFWARALSQAIATYLSLTSLKISHLTFPFSLSYGLRHSSSILIESRKVSPSSISQKTRIYSY